MPFSPATLRRLRTRPARGLSLVAALLALGPTLLAARPRAPKAGDVPDPIVAGTMPENYLPGLMDLVHAALAHSPTMLIQQLEVAQSEANLLATDAQLYPQVSANGSYGLSNESVGLAGEFGAQGSHSTGNSTSESYGIGAGMPVFRWGAVWNSIRIAKLSLLISRKSYADGYRGFVLQLRDGYLALVGAKMGLRNARFSLKAQEDAYALARENLKNGMIPPSAIAGAQLAADDARLTFDRMEANYSHAKRALSMMAGVPDLADDSIPADLPPVAYSTATADGVLAAFLRDGAESTFQAQNMEMSVRQAQLNYRIALTRQLPQFSAGYSYGAADTTSIGVSAQVAGQPPVPPTIAKVGTVTTSYSINASWDIFDGFSTVAGIRSAKAGRRIAEHQLETYLETTLEQGQVYRRDVDFAARAMALAETRRNFAQSGYDQAVSDHKFGSQPQSMVDNARYTLYLSEQNLLSARSDFLSRWSLFVSLVGADPALGLLPVQYVRATR